jgi:hypothetical protein
VDGTYAGNVNTAVESYVEEDSWYVQEKNGAESDDVATEFAEDVLLYVATDDDSVEYVVPLDAEDYNADV